MRLKTLSASSHSCYSMCEFQWALKYVLGFEDQAGSAALVGTAVHEVCETLSLLRIENASSDDPRWNVEKLWQAVLNRHMDENPLLAAEITPEVIQKQSKGLDELLASNYSPLKSPTIHAELAFQLPMEGRGWPLVQGEDGSLQPVRITGRIDRVDCHDHETIEVVDLKTGSRTNWEKPGRPKKDLQYFYADDIQSRIYHLAARKLFPHIKNILVTFLYLTDGGAVTVPFCPEDVVSVENDLLRRVKTILDNNDPQRTISWKCRKLCHFGKNGTCDRVWQEREELGWEFVTMKYQTLNKKA